MLPAGAVVPGGLGPVVGHELERTQERPVERLHDEQKRCVRGRQSDMGPVGPARQINLASLPQGWTVKAWNTASSMRHRTESGSPNVATQRAPGPNVPKIGRCESASSQKSHPAGKAVFKHRS